MDKLKRVSWGIIGCGDVTEVKSGPALQNVDNSELVAVMRRNGELAQDYAQRHGVPRWYDKANDLINDPEVNAVYIATPPSSHKDYCLKVAEAGKPVYVEKPMAMTHSECQEMIQACQQAGVPLYVAYYRRSLPRYTMVKEFIDAGILGNIQSVNVTLHHLPQVIDRKGKYHWRVDPAVAGAGYFYDLGSHIFDLLQYLLGPIVRVSGYASNVGKLYKAEDQVSCSFKFASGITGTGSFLFHASQHIDGAMIIGDKKNVAYSHFAGDEVYLGSGGKPEVFNKPNPRHIQQPLIQTIVDELTGEGSCPSTGETGAATNWVMGEILGVK
ncbi:MAG: Gfo/Idh/MocA family oxidoreductase [Candidatus Marinimicrobia bacterium]|nr:Gfo/Idh/MocA family oxidoreductase [Candidatus Neomarinimicrobiota bacterium]